MELDLTAIYEKAKHLGENLADVKLGTERVHGAKRTRKINLEMTKTALADFSDSFNSKVYDDMELADKLANTCLETASFLFCAGAEPEVWRQWTALAGAAFYLAGDYSYAMQLLLISRAEMSEEVTETLKNAELPGYRDQAIRFVIFRPENAESPTKVPAHPLSEYYANLIRALESNNRSGLLRAIRNIVEFWLAETQDEEFELGNYPFFEPESNALVAALVKQGVKLNFRSPKIKNFLRAALED